MTAPLPVAASAGRASGSATASASEGQPADGAAFAAELAALLGLAPTQVAQRAEPAAGSQPNPVAAAAAAAPTAAAGLPVGREHQPQHTMQVAAAQTSVAGAPAPGSAVVGEGVPTGATASGDAVPTGTAAPGTAPTGTARNGGGTTEGVHPTGGGTTEGVHPTGTVAGAANPAGANRAAAAVHGQATVDVQAPTAGPTAAGPAAARPARAAEGHRPGAHPALDAATLATAAPTPATAPPSASVAPAAPAAAAPAAAAPTPAAQIAAPLLPLRAEPDGIHRLTVHLHPADLGPVSLVAEIRGGDIHLHLAGATEVGREALRAALPELRRELQDAGFQASSLDVAADPHQDAYRGAPGQGQPRQQPAPGPAYDRSPTVPHTTAPIPAAPTPTGAGKSGLDVSL